MSYDNPESGEALNSAFEIMADRIQQVAEAVAWIDQAAEQNLATNNVVSLVSEKSNDDYTLAA
jgi:hypothetical protein